MTKQKLCKFCRLPVKEKWKRLHFNCNRVKESARLQVFIANRIIWNARRDGRVDVYGRYGSGFRTVEVTKRMRSDKILSICGCTPEPWVMYEHKDGGIRYRGVDLETWQENNGLESPIRATYIFFPRLNFNEQPRTRTPVPRRLTTPDFRGNLTKADRETEDHWGE